MILYSILKIDENECLTPEQKIEVKALITEYADIFCDDESSVAQGVERVIETGSARPIQLSPYRASLRKDKSLNKKLRKC